LVLLGLIKILEKGFNIQHAENLAPIERIGGAVVSIMRVFLIFGIIGMQLLLIPVGGLHDSILKGSKTAMFFVRIDADIYSLTTRYVDFVEDLTAEEVIAIFSKPEKEEA